MKSNTHWWLTQFTNCCSNKLPGFLKHLINVCKHFLIFVPYTWNLLFINLSISTLGLWKGCPASHVLCQELKKRVKRHCAKKEVEPWNAPLRLLDLTLNVLFFFLDIMLDYPIIASCLFAGIKIWDYWFLIEGAAPCNSWNNSQGI